MNDPDEQPIPDYTELTDKPLPPDDFPEEQFLRWCGGRAGYNDWLERMDD